LHSVWFLIHIIAAAISGAAFNVGGVMSILYLIKKRAEERDNVRGYLERLPSSRKIDLIAYRFLAFAFPLWTFTVIAGSIWAAYPPITSVARWMPRSFSDAAARLEA